LLLTNRLVGGNGNDTMWVSGTFLGNPPLDSYGSVRNEMLGGAGNDTIYAEVGEGSPGANLGEAERAKLPQSTSKEGQGPRPTRSLRGDPPESTRCPTWKFRTSPAFAGKAGWIVCDPLISAEPVPPAVALHSGVSYGRAAFCSAAENASSADGRTAIGR
jgi:RTX calcium-binding nonapeptide repeat (4 copies)